MEGSEPDLYLWLTDKDPYPDADPDPQPCFKITKSWIFTQKIYLNWETEQKTYLQGTKAFLKGMKPF